MNAKQALALESIPSVAASDVMKTAWALAKLIANEYGVSAKSLLPQALKQVWAKVNVKVSLFGAYESRQTLGILGFVFNSESKAWEKTMELGEFKRPQAVKFGRGLMTVSKIESAFAHQHKIAFV